MIHVISTGLDAPTKHKCLASVAGQILHRSEWTHTYVEAGAQSPRKCELQNIVEAVAALRPKPDDIIVSLDGDDWFHSKDVLTRIADIYDDPNIWVTYGSFVHADGRRGFASEYPTENFRGDEWRGTHLKTFRAPLFAHLTDVDLKRNGEYRDLCVDMTIMFPMLEMAGLEHSRFVSDVLYVYNYASSFEHNSPAAERQREREMNLELRSMPRREKLASL